MDMEEEAENHATNGSHLKRQVQPNVWKTPIVLRDGTVMAPPNASFTCAACFWMTGTFRKFSLNDYSVHVSVCVNVSDWTKEEAGVFVVPLRGNDKLQIQRRPATAAPSPHRPLAIANVDPAPPVFVNGSNQKNASFAPQPATPNASIAEAMTAEGKPEAESIAAAKEPVPKQDSSLNDTLHGSFAAEKQSSDTMPLPIAIASTSVAQAFGDDDDTSQFTMVNENEELKRQRRAKRMLAMLAPTNNMPITTTRWYAPEFEPGIGHLSELDSKDALAVRKSRRKRLPPVKFPEPKTTRTQQPLAYKDFEVLWEMAEESFLQRTAEAVEAQNQFRVANKRMDPADTVDQSSAQYGRIELTASKILLEALNVCKNDTFLDIGHGLANVVLQAAYVIGCASRGIEVVRVRYEASIQFEFALRDAKIAQELQWDVDYGTIGKVDLVCGRLEDPYYREFLTTPALIRGQQQGAMKVFFNNFGSVFSEKSAKHGHKYYLDDFVAGLFCSMPEGSILISCSLLNMPSTRSKILRQRPDAKDSGFYEYETVDLGSAHAAVSWAGGSNFHRIVGHKYTRVGPAYYICGKCGQRTEAYQTLEDGKRVPKMCCLDNFAGLRPRKEPKTKR